MALASNILVNTKDNIGIGVEVSMYVGVLVNLAIHDYPKIFEEG